MEVLVIVKEEYNITIKDLIIFREIKINGVNLESYRMHLTGLISSE